jgi:hypothetical protein
MYFRNFVALTALTGSALAFPRPAALEKRDFTSNGVYYVVTTTTLLVTTTIDDVAGPTSIVGFNSTSNSTLLASQNALPSSSSFGDILTDLLPSTSAAAPSTAASSLASVPTTSVPLPVVPITPPATTSSPPPAPAAPSSAAPASSAAPPVQANAAGGLTAAEVLQVAPDSSNCDNPPEAGECITGAQAAPAIAASYSKYEITNNAAQAATLAWMVFESGSFKYNQKHFPPTPGQGTRNMMSPTYVSEYATALYGAAKVQAAGSPAAVLALVQDTNNSCGSAAWFLKTQCPDVLTQFATDPEGAWTAFNGPGCISTTLTDDRTAVWTAAKAALGVTG